MQDAHWLVLKVKMLTFFSFSQIKIKMISSELLLLLNLVLKIFTEEFLNFCNVAHEWYHF